jgi:hypothetical protein
MLDEILINIIISCRKLKKITNAGKKSRGEAKKMKSRVIFQYTFATKLSKDKQKEWHLPSHKEPTKAISTQPMPNSMP